jgi:hypothetical protein
MSVRTILNMMPALAIWQSSILFLNHIHNATQGTSISELTSKVYFAGPAVAVLCILYCIPEVTYEPTNSPGDCIGPDVRRVSSSRD